MGPLLIPVKVLRKSQEAMDICSFELVHADDGLLPAFDAGSHIDVHLPGGIVRQYSLCNDPVERHRYRITVLRDSQSRGGSTTIHEQVHEGDELQISEPRNHFPLVQARKTLLLAGGIGITPLLCMAQRLHAMGADFTLHYCTRSRDRTAFFSEISRAPFRGEVHFHHDDGPSDQRLDLGRALSHDAGTHLYVCGPAGFIDWILKAAAACGWQPGQIHREYFGAVPRDTSSDTPFEVKIASTGSTYFIPAGKTVAQALRDCGVEVLTSCEQGVCGTCLTRILQGVPDHRDKYLTSEEQALNDQFLPCCSRAKSPSLVLDL
jgi:vanillate O-demethylase ferredoxin subunit